MPIVLHRHCPQCYTDNQSLKRLPASPKRWPIKHCPHCGFVYLERAATYEELKKDFAWEKTSAQESARRQEAEPVVTKLSQAAKTFRKKKLKRDKLPILIQAHIPAGRVVDIGCADGNTLSRLPTHHQKIGIEISSALAAKVSRRLPEAHIVHADALSGLQSLPADHCSGVIMSAFLEHEAEPQLLLSEALRVLQPLGTVIIKVPNYGSWNRRVRGKKWCGFRFPDHVNYFTPSTMRRMVTQLGFSIKKFSFIDRLPTNDNMWIVLQKPAQPATGTTTARACSTALPAEEPTT
jgi:SAM-dependent methyltransferase